MNAAFLSIHHIKKFDSISGLYCGEHWLSFKQLSLHRLLCVIYNVLHSGFPRSLGNLLNFRAVSRSLRSSMKGQLSTPRVSTAMEGKAFSVAAPWVWNSLPERVK